MRIEADTSHLAALPLGQRVAAFRGRRGLSQEVLAGLLGRSKSWLEKVERGARRLDSLDVLWQIADLLDADPRILLARPPSPQGDIDE